MRSSIRLIPLLFLVLTATGCSFNMGTLTTASTKNISLPHTVIKKAVEGEDCAKSLLFIPLGSLVPNIQEAADKALAKTTDANALTDVVIYSEPLVFLIYNQVCLKVRGDAVKIDFSNGAAQ